ncbi:tripartite tricarboxylate transporter TctB family protein [Tepidicella baoligensis]|uniref:tripartite tricarboxylate transporter TctB family protein n=1 Tax=Tepidicella baoligensis TaxID=2707016 RepID=UPI0015D96F3D|nr:tripartite tricarboxylate transporter TctB family protein [Tepidicella baoligensis]
MSANRILAVIIGLLSAAYLWAAFQIPVFPIPRPVDSDAFPKLLGVLMLGLSVWLFFEKDGAAAPTEEGEAVRTPWERWQPVVVTSVAIAVYAFALGWMGFVLASFLLTAGLTWFYGYRRHGINAIVSLAVPLGLYLVMTRFMNIHLPAGWLPI